MDNINEAVFFFVCIVLSAAAFVFYGKQRHGTALFLLVMLGLLLRVHMASDGFLHSWDERYHALVAKHLARHFFEPTLYENTVLPLDYKNWTYCHIWLHKQPLGLWCIALSIKVFGAHLWAVRIPSIGLSTIGIY